jgi:hypothetical protein
VALSLSILDQTASSGEGGVPFIPLANTMPEHNTGAKIHPKWLFIS